MHHNQKAGKQFQGPRIGGAAISFGAPGEPPVGALQPSNGVESPFRNACYPPLLEVTESNTESNNKRSGKR